MKSRVLQGFAPIADKQTRILVLGSMPSRASLEKQEYYGNPHNAFWKIIAKAFEQPLEAYEDKKALLLKHHIALWDVLASCQRNGSGDAEICEAQPNDIAGFLAKHTAIQKVLLNGGFAAAHWEKYCGHISLPYVRMPSTSPAHARMGFEEKLEIWRKELR